MSHPVTYWAQCNVCAHKMPIPGHSFGTDPELEMVPILRHLNGCNFLIPNPSALVDPSI